MRPNQYAQSVPGEIQATKLRGVERPWGVAIVALFQALKAGALLLTGLLLHFSPETVIASRSALYSILYIALRGRASLLSGALNRADALLGIMLILGAYLAYNAWGLWQMRLWARKAMMLTSGMTLALSAKSIFMSGPGEAGLSDVSFFAPSLGNLHLLLVIDVAIFVYLMRGSTASRFGA